MSWLNPAGAWWLLLLLPLLLLYILRPRPRQQAVSSFRLWLDLPQVERPRSRVRRPPLSLLLIIQLILLTIGAVALVRPALTHSAGQHEIVLLDASASMQATDGPTIRFEQARQAARDLAARMSEDDAATLLRVSTQVVALCSACGRADFESSLSAAKPGAGHADWATAFSTAKLVQAGQGRQISYVVISDGAYDALTATDLPPAVRFVSVGHALDNRAITVLSAERRSEGGPAYNAYTRVENSGATTATITVEALADTVPLPSRKLSIPAGGKAELLWPLPVGTARLTVRLTPPDALALDDSAVLVLPTEAEHAVRISSDQPDIYRRVLAGLPGMIPITATTATTTTADLTIVEGKLPATLPSGSLLLVNPQGDLLPSKGELLNVRPLLSDVPHPLVSGLDLRALLVTRGQKIDAPSWLEEVISAADGPLVLAGNLNGARIVVLTFDPRDSNLPQLTTFPLLMANLVDWLDPLASGGALHPGDVLPLAPGTTVAAPDGKSTQVGPAGVFAATDEVGLYTVARLGRDPLVFAVDATDAQEANLTPQAHPELTRSDAGQAPPQGVPLELWEPLALLALLLVGTDWLVYCWKRGQA